MNRKWEQFIFKTQNKIICSSVVVLLFLVVFSSSNVTIEVYRPEPPMKVVCMLVFQSLFPPLQLGRVMVSLGFVTSVSANLWKCNSLVSADSLLSRELALIQYRVTPQWHLKHSFYLKPNIAAGWRFTKRFFRRSDVNCCAGEINFFQCFCL